MIVIVQFYISILYTYKYRVIQRFLSEKDS